MTGYRIVPFDVESAPPLHPAVAEAAVVDVVKTRVGRHQYPRASALVDELPKTETGTIQRFRLRQQA